MDRTKRRTLGIFAAMVPYLWLSSCAWNKAFLHPDVIPATAEKGQSIDPITKDTIVLHFTLPDHVPSFTDKQGQALPMPFHIESAWFGDPDTSLYGWMLKDTTGIPATSTILFLHGNGGNLLTEYPVMLPFVQEGSQVFVFDYSGFGSSKGKATRKHVHEDAIAALEYLRTRPDVQGTKVVVYGRSLGGHTAALLAGDRPALCDAVVIEGGFGSFREIAKRSVRLGSIAKLLVSEGPSASEALANYNGPLLVVHSTEDEVVPIDLGRDLFNAGNGPKEWLEIQGPHCAGPFLQAELLADRIQRMLSVKD